MNIAYRFRIYPTEEQKILLGKTFGCCRFLYNQMLNDKIREYAKTKKMLKNTPAMYKKMCIRDRLSVNKKPIFVASEQGLDTSVCKRVFNPQRLKSQI